MIITDFLRQPLLRLFTAFLSGLKGRDLEPVAFAFHYISAGDRIGVGFDWG